MGRIRGMGRHPDKYVINALTKIAEGVRDGEFPNIRPQDLVGVVEARMLRAHPVEKLPVLYLLDSIMFNAKDPYPALFGASLPTLFMKIYEVVDQPTKDRMRRLLQTWENRKPKEGALAPKTLADIQRRLDPSFDTTRFLHNQSLKFPGFSENIGSVKPTARASTIPSAPSSRVSQAQYDQMLVKHAGLVLNRLQDQMQVPYNHRIRLQDLPQNPPLWHQVYDEARKELSNQGISVLHQEQPQQVPSAPPPQGSYDQFANPAAVSQKRPRALDQQSLRDPAGAVEIASKLYFMCSENGSFQDPLSGLKFLSTDAMMKYQTYRGALKQQLDESKKPVPPNKILRRAWLNSLKSWTQGREQQLKVIQIGFDGEEVLDNDDTQLGENNVDAKRLSSFSSITSGEPNAGVVVDPSQTHCALTGEEFEKTLDEETGQWVYKGTVRPDPDGKIYLAEAYYQHLEEQQQNRTSTKRPHSDAPPEEETKRLKLH